MLLTLRPALCLKLFICSLLATSFIRSLVVGAGNVVVAVALFQLGH